MPKKLPPLFAANAIRCVAFDAVGTLIFAEPTVAAAYAAIGRQFGSRLEQAAVAIRFRAALRQLDVESSRWDGEVGATSEQHEREFWRRVVHDVLYDVSDPDACFTALFKHFAQPSSWRCFDDVAGTLHELRRRGYQAAIASNFDARLNRVCDELSELRGVTCRAISSLVGYRKTHPAFFAALATQAGCSAGEILVVGDDWENDVLAAQRAGCAALHLRREFAEGTVEQSGVIRSLTELLERLP